MFAVGVAFFGAVIAAAAVITSADAYFASVVLLMHLDSYFSVEKGHIVAVTGAVTSSTQKLFNQNTAHFNGSSDYLSLPASADFLYGTGDFTIEMFAFHETDVTNLRTLYSSKLSSANPLVLGIYSGKCFVYDGSTFIIHAGAPVLNSWNHIALVRSGTVVTLYIASVSIGSATVAAARAFGSDTAMTHIGANPDFGQFSSGYLSQIRLTKGIARYTTATFSPPNAPF